MKRHALFVGVDQYADGHIPNLSCAVSDATDLHGFFKYGAGYDRVELLQNPAGKKEVLGTVREMTAGLGSGDFFLFFFAGHGFRVGENHVLVCAKDLYEDVKYEDDGLPLGQLKRRLSAAFDSALFLDACQSDILATRGGEGIAERDLSLIHETRKDEMRGGALTIVTSCDAGQTAAELSEARHGLFTMAMLDLLKEAQGAHSRLDLSDAFRINLGRRMGEIAARAGLSTEQRPRFSCTGDSCFILLDGSASGTVTSFASLSGSTSSVYVICPECGKHNLISETFRCKACGRDNLCLSHFSSAHNSCMACANVALPKRRESAREMNGKGDDYYWGRNGVKQDYVEAIWWYRKAAEQGDVDAQFNLGWMYRNGYGVAQSDADAVSWYRKAAEQGYARAQSSLGRMYQYGRGVAQSDADAVSWYRKAAEQGHAHAQINLGWMYQYGRGVAQSDADAVSWYRKAADQGHAHAQSNLGWMYLHGHGVAQSDADAVTWYRKAAEQGDADAQINLGWMYQYGRGVAQSDADALLWYQKAADQGSEDAKQRLLKFRAQMSSSAVADEQTYYDVILKSFGSNKISVIATIREITGLGLADAKEMVECAPRLVRERVSKETAEDVAGRLRRVGAEVEVRRWGEPAMKKFVCSMCGYADVGQTAPKRCPQCGTPGPRFKEVDVAVE